MNGDITLEALRRCQRASKVISPFIIFAVFDVLFRRYKLWINYSFFTYIFDVLLSRFKCRLPEYFGYEICV